MIYMRATLRFYQFGVLQNQPVETGILARKLRLWILKPVSLYILLLGCSCVRLLSVIQVYFEMAYSLSSIISQQLSQHTSKPAIFHWINTFKIIILHKRVIWLAKIPFVWIPNFHS